MVYVAHKQCSDKVKLCEHIRCNNIITFTDS